MATGHGAFPGRVPVLICEAILNRSPEPPSQLNRLVPARLELIITKALEKDRARRYQNASEVLSDLESLRIEIKSSSGLSGRVESEIRPRAWTAFIILLLMIASIAGVSWWKFPKARPIERGEVPNSTKSPPANSNR